MQSPQTPPDTGAPLSASDQQALNAIYKYAADMMKQNRRRAFIIQKLQERGLSNEAATRVVDNLQKVRQQMNKNTAGRDMLIGGLFCIGGILVTALTYSAVSKSGGSYVVAYGAIIFGALQFLRGLFNAMRE